MAPETGRTRVDRAATLVLVAMVVGYLVLVGYDLLAGSPAAATSADVLLSAATALWGGWLYYGADGRELLYAAGILLVGGGVARAYSTLVPEAAAVEAGAGAALLAGIGLYFYVAVGRSDG